MIKNIVVFISLFFFICSTFSHGQSKSIVNVDGSGYLVKVENINPEYKEQKTTGIIKRDYTDFTDPSNPGTYKLPFINIFLAIPKNSAVKISNVKFNSRTEEKVIPTLNPLAVLKDSAVEYIPQDYSDIKYTESRKSVTHIEKYFWFREFYLVQINVNNVLFHEDKSSIETLSNIEFRVNIVPYIIIVPNSPVQINTVYDKILSNMISNGETAEQFRNAKTIALDDSTGNWIDYNATYLKMGVEQDAVYRITNDDLVSVGINTTNLDPRTFKLYESGNELKIYVKGEEDGIFDGTDFIEFWGHKNYPAISYHIINEDDEEYNEYLNRYTDSTFYFLTWNGAFGKRADSLSLDPSGITDSLFYYSKLLHTEINQFFDFNNNNEVENQTPNWNKNKTWYQHTLTTTRTYNFSLSDIYPDQLTSINAKAVSWASNIQNNSHQVRLFLNNVLIDSNSIDRFKQLLLLGQVNSSSLINGTNQVKLENIPNGSDPNGLLVDWYEIKYPRNLKLSNDSLYFKIANEVSPGIKILKVLNASVSEYEIFKVNPEFKKVSGYSVNSSVLFFADTVNAGDEYYVLEKNKHVTPKYYYVKNFSNLRSLTNQLDYIAITYPGFVTAAENYTQVVSGFFNINASVFSTDDIYDEFSFGYPYPEGIRLFLNVYYNNVQEPKPQYLSLIGDANYDYKYFSGVSGRINYVTTFGNPVSDNWFAIWDLQGIPIPQLKVGRIPITSTNQLQYYLDKVANNESHLYDEWNKRYLFFSGGILESEYEQLKSVNDTLINRLIKPRPIGGKYSHFYKTINPPSDFGPYTPSQIQNAIQNGGLFISYIGHSGTATWDNSINETNQLFNLVNRNPLITDFGCSTNKYAEPDIVCFGERFLFNETGQAISYVGNSSLGFQSTAITVPKYFYESIISDSISEIGNANLYSKVKLIDDWGNTAVNRIFALSNVILGDPAVRIKIPKSPNFIISSSDVFTTTPVITDKIDSALIKIVIHNFGKADTGDLKLHIVQSLNAVELKNIYLDITIPEYSDTVRFWALTNGYPGYHTLDIEIDPDNLISEIYENDNTTTFGFNVASGSLRDLLTSGIENPSITNLVLLNPSIYNSNQFEIETEISSDTTFANPVSVRTNSDSVFSQFVFPQLTNGHRYYLRYKINNQQENFSAVKSFYNDYDSKFLLIDSVSFTNQTLHNLNWLNDTIKVLPDTINISVLSAGWYSGATCVIAKDGINLLSNSFFAGMGIAIFDNITFAVDTATWFQLFNEPQNVEALANLIDSIPPGKIVAIGVADDARNNLSNHLKNAIKSLGSSKIDSLQFRGSWALIGWKGAPAGSVIEQVKPPLPPETIFIDTSYVFQSDSGSMITKEIGPADKWKFVKISQLLPGDALSEYYLYGIKATGQIDSLGLMDFENNISDISNINSRIYTRIQIKCIYHVSSNSISPSLTHLEVDFVGLPELATNYQVVSASADTVTVGENIDLNFSVFNVGESKADSFLVTVDVVNDDNSRQNIFSQNLDSLTAGGKSYFHLSFNTSAAGGSKSFLITIDKENNVRELFEDNNFFTIPFYIKPDTTTPTLTLTIDGNDIVDGEYISSTPVMHIELNDFSLLAINDRNSVMIFLNNVEIPNDTSIINYEFSTNNPKVKVDFTPQLADGEYSLKVLWRDFNGNIVDSSGVQKFFLVSSEAKILDVYNYPNPFTNETYFTFKLTQIPDEIKIKIFTIAGRLIRELEFSSSDLRYDFNKISWDGTDQDGDKVANGVYLYKVIMKAGEKSESVTQKLAVVR